NSQVHQQQQQQLHQRPPASYSVGQHQQTALDRRNPVEGSSQVPSNIISNSMATGVVNGNASSGSVNGASGPVIAEQIQQVLPLEADAGDSDPNNSPDSSPRDGVAGGGGRESRRSGGRRRFSRRSLGQSSFRYNRQASGGQSGRSRRESGQSDDLTEVTEFYQPAASASVAAQDLNFANPAFESDLNLNLPPLARYATDVPAASVTPGRAHQQYSLPPPAQQQQQQFPFPLLTLSNRNDSVGGGGGGGAAGGSWASVFRAMERQPPPPSVSTATLGPAASAANDHVDVDEGGAWPSLVDPRLVLDHFRSTGVADAWVQHDDGQDMSMDELLAEAARRQGFAITPGLIDALVGPEAAAALENRSAGTTPRLNNLSLFSPRFVTETPRSRAGQQRLPLPPSVLGQMRFDDQSAASAGDNSGQGRKFLSVVSVDEGVWDDLVAKDMPPIDLEALASQRSDQQQKQKTPLSSARGGAAAEAEDAPQSGGDSVTLAKIDRRYRQQQQQDDEEQSAEPAAGQPPDRQPLSWESLQRAGHSNAVLQDMEKRLRLIADMSDRFDSDYERNKRLLSTIIELQSADQSQTYEPDDGQRDRSPQRQPLANQTNMTEQRPAAGQQQAPPVHQRKDPDPFTPRRDLARTPPMPDSNSEVPPLELDQLHSHRSAGASANAPASSHRRRGAAAAAVKHQLQPQHRTPEERAQLRQWMEQRRKEQLGQYRKQKQERREAEARPYQGGAGGGGAAPTVSDWKAAEAERQRRREQLRAEREQREEAHLRRLMQEDLSGAASSGGLRDSHEAIRPRLEPQKSAIQLMEEELAMEQRRMAAAAKAASNSSRRNAKDKSGRQVDSGFGLRGEFQTDAEYEDYLNRMVELSSAAASEAMLQQASSNRPTPREPDSEDELVPYQPPPQKPLTQVVRMQRPELTRKGPSRRPDPQAQRRLHEQMRQTPVMITKRQAEELKRQASMKQAAKGGRAPAGGRAAAQPESDRRPASPSQAESLDDITWSLSDDMVRIVYGDAGRPAQPQQQPGSARSDSQSHSSFIDWDEISSMLRGN
uniref:RING-type domain-containing protein n=1 Tax=Macrostomum lignano TaxID=282301 RepID=A0A1I8I5A1_9PLAT